MNYCTECGKKLIEITTNKYDGETGEPVKIKVCPSEMCGHAGYAFHIWKSIPLKWYELGFCSVVCQKCGEKLRI